MLKTSKFSFLVQEKFNVIVSMFAFSFGAQTPMQPSGLNNHAVLMIGRCWSQLRVLCIGGADVSVKGLAAIGGL